MRAIQGMNIAPQVQWYHPNGSQVEMDGRVELGVVETTGTVTFLSLTFSPVLHDDGGVYSCRAQVTVPWMTTQPPVKQAGVNMAVISKLNIIISLHERAYKLLTILFLSSTAQAMFQLRMGPLTHCSSWEVQYFPYFMPA